MCVILFEDQLRHGFPDTAGNSIALNNKLYDQLPVLSPTVLGENCTYTRKAFFDQVRDATRSRPAIWISHEDWVLNTDTTDVNQYLDNNIYWIFVCIGIPNNKWIAFQYYNLADMDEAYNSTVSVSIPRHGTVYRLDEECMDIVRKFFP